MRKLIFLFLLFPGIVFSQTDWSVDAGGGNAFIKNQGQFDGRNWQKNKVEYGLEDGYFYVFFTKKGLSYRLDKMIRNGKEHEERKDKHEPEWKNISELIHVTWLNANKKVKIIAEDPLSEYFSFAVKDTKTKKVSNVNHVSGYRKLIYKNLYDHIDVIYEINPEKGFEYSLLLHQGADLSQVKMKYSSAHTNRKDEFVRYYLDELGNVQIKTSLGHIVESDLKTFYKNGTPITSSYSFNNNILSFNLANYDNTQEVIIDPWVVSETANGVNSSSAVWEVETDDAGNVYTISNEYPMQLKKYNSTGSLQWTYDTPWDTASVWIGTLATDGTGTSYVTSGTTPEIERIDNTGTLVWHANGGSVLGSTSEWWSITFNCDKSKLIVGGTYIPNGLGFDYYSAIFDMDITNGNVLNYQTFDYINLGGIVFPLPTPIEVRGICAAKNAKYFFLTHDGVGLINQNFGLCPNPQPIFYNDNGHHYSYKCENYLPETQNGGGLKAITANDNYFYVHTGDRVEQRSYVDGSVINSVAIPGGQASTDIFGEIIVKDCGLDVDNSGNVYVGSDGVVVKYDQNLNLISQINVGFTVYDVSVNSNGEVIAVGAVYDNSNSTDRQGKVQSVNLSAGPQYVASCCDANICPPQPLCYDASPVTLSASTSGGTWSGTGITNASTGTFDPSVAGIGTHWVYYTLSCGMDSVQIEVLDCTPITVCDDGTNLVASGGTGALGHFSWNEQQTQSTSIITEQDCIDCPNATPQYTFGFYTGCSVNTCTQDVWVEYTTGTTAAPPATWPLMVTNGIDTVIFNSQAEISPCSACTPPTLSVTGTDVTCAGGSDGTVDLTVTPGSGTSYTYSWTGPNSFTATTEDLSGLSAGTYDVTVTDASNSSCTATATITINDGAPTEDAGFTLTDFCEGSSNSATITGVPGGTFSFAPDLGDGSTINSSTGEITNGVAGTTYTVQYVTTGTCPGTSTQTVTVNANPTPTIAGSTTFCTGSSTTLDAGTGYSSYSWSTGVSTQTYVVNTAGNYSVTVTDNNGCIGSAQISVTEASSLSPVISGNLSFCTGGSTMLDVGSGFASYAWNTGATTQTITVTSAGTYSVSVADAGGCSGDTQVVVTENPLPTPTITGSLTFCTGNSTTLDAGSGYISYLWSTGDITPTITVTVAGTYSVTVTDAAGCDGSTQVIVTEATNLSPTITGSLTFCPGSSTTLDAGSGFSTYSWNTGATTQTLTVTSAGTYSVTVTDAGGCTGTDQVTTSESASITPTITGVLSICTGNTTTIDAGTGYSTYLWNTGDTTQTISVSVAGTYSVTVTDGGGCSGSDQVDVIELPGLSPVITGNTNICAGNSTTLSVSSGYSSYLWSTGASNSSISVSAEGTYSVTVTNANGCSGSTQVTVQSSPPIFFNVFSNDADICPGEPVEINGVVTGGLPPYVLYDGNGNVINFPYIVYPADTTTYNLSVQDACGGTQTGSVDVIVYPVPEPAFTSDIIEGCQPLIVQFNETHDYSSYLWSFGDNSYNHISYEHNPQHTFQNSGTFDVSVTATNEYGCSASFTFPEMITVYPKPDAKFTADPSIASIVHPLVNFYNYSVLNDLNFWSFGDGDSSLVVDPYHLYPDTGTYIVALIVETQKGCKDTTMSSILIRPEITFYAPTAFSPDGDNLNDVFFVTGTGIDTANFHLYVYDRWGEIIFESDDIAKVWDGTTADGKIAENGTYVWLCYYYDIFAIAHEETGQVMIIR